MGFLMFFEEFGDQVGGDVVVKGVCGSGRAKSEVECECECDCESVVGRSTSHFNQSAETQNSSNAMTMVDAGTRIASASRAELLRPVSGPELIVRWCTRRQKHSCVVMTYEDSDGQERMSTSAPVQRWKFTRDIGIIAGLDKSAGSKLKDLPSMTR
jgi:hypothetical protein